MTTFLCIAPNYWGRGPTIADAKAQVKKEGGSLTRYMIFECDDPNVAVDELGYILYQRGATLTEVMRRPKRKGGDR